MTRGRSRAFTLLELLVVISIIVILIAILLPALLGATRGGTANRNRLRLKTTLDAMSKFARGNHDFLPGLASTGAVAPAGSIPLNANAGSYPEARAALLLAGAFVSPESLVNPIDPDGEPYRPSGAGAIDSNTGIQTGGSLFVRKNLSFAMLRLNTAGSPRHAAWTREVNPRAPLLCDRNTGGNATSQVSSVWTEIGKGTWNGNVGWGDLHVTFEQTHLVKTEYPGTATINSDNLFNDGDAGTTGQEADAMMVYQDAVTGFNQKP